MSRQADKRIAPQPNGKTRRQTRHYTDAERRTAVAVMLSVADSDGGQTIESFSAARSVLGYYVSDKVLSAWVLRYRDEIKSYLPVVPQKPASEVVAIAQDSILSLYNTLLRKILTRVNLDEVINAASFRDLMVGAGISTDKVLKFVGLNPELLERAVTLAQLCPRKGLDTRVVLDTMITSVERKPDVIVIDNEL